MFFGGGWGESDTYLTPVGELYGVEVHAAAYLSIGDPPRAISHLFGALVELLMAFLVGVAFTCCWRGYFRQTFDPSPAGREHAVVWLVILAGVIPGSVAAFVLSSWGLLAWGLWLSPIPIIAGMAIDTFVVSVREAASVAGGDKPTHVRLPRSSRVLRFFVHDPRELYRSNEPNAHRAAYLLFFKRLAWLGVVGYGLWLILPLKKEALMRLITSVLVAAVLAAPGQAQAQAPCTGLAAVLSGVSKAELRPKLESPTVQETAKAGGTACASFRTVIGKVIGRDMTAGRRLEKDRPFNPAAAQANEEKALRDPEVRKRIAALRREVPDETVRLLYEAVVFDEEGYYDARELRIQQLRQRLN